MNPQQLSFNNFIQKENLKLAAQNAARLAEESNFNQQLKRQFLNNEVSDSKSIRGLRRMEKVNKFIDIIKNFFGGLFGWMFRSEFPLAHYITLILVIILLLSLTDKSRGGSIIPNLRISSQLSGFIPRLIYKIKAFLKRIFGFFIPAPHRFNSFTKLLTPFGSTQQEGIARSKINGRCDMIEWREVGGLCQKTTKPSSIRWVLSLEQMPELNELPEEIIKKITANGNKLVIDIPYEKIGTQYIPDCSKMTFFDGKPASLFIQKNQKDTLCRFVEKPSKKYIDTAIKRDSREKDVYKLCK